MSDLPPAQQTYKPLNKVSKVSRSTVCPIHKKQTSDYLGANQRTGVLVWVFRCTASDHVFAAKPDAHTPKPGQEDAWILREEQKRVQKTMAKRQ